jgi:uncharacterized protein (TIGR03067 family)
MNGAWIVALAGLVFAAQDAKKDLDKLQGTWVVQSVEQGGQANPNARGDIQTIQGDKIIFNTKDREMKWTLKLDPGKTPKQIAFTFTEGQQSVTSLGIYALEGDELRLCMAPIPGGTERPKTLESKKGEKYIFTILKREKK